MGTIERICLGGIFEYRDYLGLLPEIETLLSAGLHPMGNKKGQTNEKIRFFGYRLEFFKFSAIQVQRTIKNDATYIQ